MHTFSIELSFVAPSRGGRSTLPDSVIGYRPHLVVAGTQEMLGVEFVAGPKPAYETPAVFEVKRLYDDVSYKHLVPGTAISLVEGPHVVANGVVKAR